MNMDRRTRVRSAMNGLPVDRVPVSFWLHYRGEEATGETNIRAQIAWYRETGLDFLKMMSDGFFQYPFSERVDRSSDWARLRPLGGRHPFIRDQVERAKRINEALQGECLTFYNAFAPFSTMRHAAGNDRVMAHLRKNPGAVTAALDVLSEDTCELARGLLEEAGCDGLFLPLQGGEVDRFTPEEYRAWIRPAEIRVIDTANRLSDLNILHLCAWDGIRNQLDLWRDIPCRTVNWAVHIEGLSLGEGRRVFGDKCVMGGFDNRPGGVLTTGTRDEVTAATHELIREAGETGLILSADCSLLAEDMPRERIHWVVEATRTAGGKNGTDAL